MENRYRFIRERDDNNQEHVLGVRIYTYNEGVIYRPHEIYVGYEFTLEDILYNEINRNGIGVKNLADFLRRYESSGATGIIFFPQTNSYGFLESGDSVINWESNLNIEDTLREAAASYTPTTKDVSSVSTVLEYLEPDDAMLELFDVPVTPGISGHSSR